MKTDAMKTDAMKTDAMRNDAMNGELVRQRTAASVDLLRRVLDDQSSDSTSGRGGLMADGRTGIGDVSLGGKHLRARLVHIAAGPVEGAAADEAILLGACVAVSYTHLTLPTI